MLGRRVTNQTLLKFPNLSAFPPPLVSCDFGSGVWLNASIPGNPARRPCTVPTYLIPLFFDFVPAVCRSSFLRPFPTAPNRHRVAKPNYSLTLRAGLVVSIVCLVFSLFFLLLLSSFSFRLGHCPNTHFLVIHSPPSFGVPPQSSIRSPPLIHHLVFPNSLSSPLSSSGCWHS